MQESFICEEKVSQSMLSSEIFLQCKNERFQKNSFQKNTKKGLTNQNKDCIVFLSNRYENRKNEKPALKNQLRR